MDSRAGSSAATPGPGPARNNQPFQIHKDFLKVVQHRALAVIIRLQSYQLQCCRSTLRQTALAEAVTPSPQMSLQLPPPSATTPQPRLQVPLRPRGPELGWEGCSLVSVTQILLTSHRTCSCSAPAPAPHPHLRDTTTQHSSPTSSSGAAGQSVTSVPSPPP